VYNLLHISTMLFLIAVPRGRSVHAGDTAVYLIRGVKENPYACRARERLTHHCNYLFDRFRFVTGPGWRPR
jgi:hypothetical protein